MKKFLLGACALVLGLAYTGTAMANSHRGGDHGHGIVVGHRGEHGIRFEGGHFYRGFDHHWERRVWDAHFGRYQYWDPYYGCWYYWDAARDCYYPIGY